MKKIAKPLTPESRFLLAAQRLTDQRGGTPTASLVNGRIVFTYPDGTVTTGTPKD
jgi:hypothetical protein